MNGPSQCWCDECGCSLLTRHTPATPNGVNKCSRREVPDIHARSNKPLYISVKRRWPKANFYMWRKPSTLNRSVHPSPQSPQSVTSELLSHCSDVLMSYTLSTTPPTIEHNTTTNVSHLKYLSIIILALFYYTARTQWYLMVEPPTLKGSRVSC